MKVSLLTTFILLLVGVTLPLSLTTPQAYAQHDLGDDAKAHFDKGHEHYKQGRYDDSIAEFKKAMEHDPKDAASLFGLGNSYFLKQDFDQAIKCYQEVTQLKPDFPKAHYALALAYRRVGKTDVAEKEFEIYNRLSTQKPAETPKPAEKKPGPKKPVVKRLEEAPPPEAKPAEKKEAPEEVLKKARPTEREGKISPERPFPKKAAPTVKVIKKGEKGENIFSRFMKSISERGPLGKVLVWLIYYTVVAQVWISIVVLFGLIILWRRR
ncbi:MAG TPA: tetratricopeptide repeat protein [Candidatus Tripitaka californicus]|uniref:tetratricopeptide repeat protein n=1 Tax=Candidatus Tripitaka californicus TaxID=3367616 RepID=UPI004027815A|nr:tetratricopeptide repeat protein [Planctomycetota bacterium]